MIEIRWNATRNELRVFSGLLILFAGVMYWFIDRHFEPPNVAIWVACILLGIAAIGLAIPQAIYWFYIGWMIRVFPIGWFVSHLILAIVYYCLITPFGILRRTIGGDPLKQKIEKDATTYWEELEQPKGKDEYFRQS